MLHCFVFSFVSSSFFNLLLVVKTKKLRVELKEKPEGFEQLVFKDST